MKSIFYNLKKPLFIIFIVQYILTIAYPAIAILNPARAAEVFNVINVNFKKDVESGSTIRPEIVFNNNTGVDLDKTEYQLTYTWKEFASDVEKDVEKENTELVSDVLEDEQSDIDQTILLQVPEVVGTYTLEIDLINQDEETFSELGFIDPYQTNVSIVDKTPPEADSLEFISGNQTEETDVTLQISATDNIGVAEMKIGTVEDLSGVEWESYSTEKTISLPNELGTYTYYAQFRDEQGNTSPVPFASATIERVGLGPDGFIQIDNGDEYARDRELTIDFSNVNDDSEIVGYKIASNEEELSNLPYTLKYPSQANINIPEASDEKEVEYTVFAQFIDEYNNESEILSDNIKYYYYEIQPQLEANSSKVLFGGEFEYSVTLKNTGQDIGYNGSIELELPKGFNLVESIEPYPGYAKINATFVDTNAEGNQIIRYNSIADLLKGEQVTIALRLQAGGSPEGYEIGEEVPISITGSLSKRSDWTESFDIQIENTVELLPFVVNTNYSSFGPTEEILVGNERDVNITIQNNPDLGSDKQDLDDNKTNPVLIYSLEDGISYVQDSFEMENYTGEYLFQAFESIDGQDNISIIFEDGFDTNHYDNTINLSFKTKVDQYNKEGNLVPHNQKIENTFAIDADYDYKNNRIDQTETFIAKYFIINKKGIVEDGNLDIGDEINYKVDITVSEFYALSGITVIDLLPDGLEYIENSSMITVDSTMLDSETGETTIRWEIVEINANEVYEYEFRAKVLPDYQGFISKLLASDYLENNIDIEAIWQNQNGDDTGFGDEDDQDWKRTNIPTFENEIKLSTESEDGWGETQDVLVGDVVNIKAKVIFPEDVPTNSFNYKFVLPVGTELLGEIDINSQGIFEKDPQNYREIIDGFEINTGKVEPGSSIEINYELKINDDPNLKLATITRNLFRADYRNVNNNKFTLRDELTLVLIEPKIDVTKQKIDGYLASGEEAIVEVKIKNNGTSTAYDIDLIDQIPQNSTLDSLIEDNSLCNIDETDFQFEINNCELAPDEEFIFSYRILPNDGLITNDTMYSKIIFDYQNRDESSDLEKRYFDEEKEFFWQAVEPVLVTSIYRGNTDNSEITEIGRDDLFDLKMEVRNIGGSPGYDNTVLGDISDLYELSEDINNVSYKVFKGGSDITGEDIYEVKVIDGKYRFSGFELKPGENFRVEFRLKTERFAEFEKEYASILQSNALNALDQPIRKDASSELSRDTDNDDRSDETLRVTKLDDTKPSGNITFRDNGEIVSATNKDKLDIDYFASDPINPGDIKNEIIAIRFSNDGENWFANDSLDPCDDANCGETLTAEKNWNQFIENPTKILNEDIAQEGKNFRYMQIVDLYENISTTKGYVLKDSNPPVLGNVTITAFENDFSNIEFTGKFDNFYHIYAEDDDGDNLSYDEYAGIGEYQYRVDENNNWSEWLILEEGVNTFETTFPTVENGEELEIFVKIRDLAGNQMQEIIKDEIIYTDEIPEVSVNLSNGDLYTNESLVKLGLDIDDTLSGVNKIRIADNEIDIFDSNWLNYTEDFDEYPLVDAFSTGDYQLCIQVQDTAGAISNIDCDNILLDNTAPQGSIEINNGNEKTSTTNVLLQLDATDPDLEDGNKGIGKVEYRVSQTGTTDPNNLDSANWSAWQSFSTQTNINLENAIGDNTIYVQYRDELGNLSEVYTDTIQVDPLVGTGNIIINENDLFTNAREVTLDLKVNMNQVGFAQYSKPLLMRFIETEDNQTPAYPPAVTNPNQNSKGWSYWEEYTDNQEKQWTLRDGFGKKNVYVQYMMPNGKVTNIYHDSIIYAPYYGIDFYENDTSANINAPEKKTYGLANIPSDMFTQDEMTIKLNAENFGSFTWPQGGENPVRISYRWKAVSFDSDQIGVGQLSDYRGNAAILPENISWNKQTGEISLKVDTPTLPGSYKLAIDAIHEGVTWFSAYGNEYPEFFINVTQNPDVEPEVITGTLDLESTEDNIGGYPACQPWGTRYTLEGTLRVSSTNPWNVNYQIIEDDGTVWWIGNRGFSEYVGQKVRVDIVFKPFIYGTSCYDFQVVSGSLRLVPKTWKAQYHSQNWGENRTIHLYRGRETTLEINYKNIGTGNWSRNRTYLKTQDNNFIYSHNKSRLPMRSDYRDVGQGSIAKFQFKLKVPNNKAPGLYNVCFNPIHTSKNLEYNKKSCFKVQVELTEAEKRTIRCNQPQKVYMTRNLNAPVIGTLRKNDEFIQISQVGNWIRIYYPKGVNQEGWIQNSDSCFTGITKVDNPIKQSVLPVTQPPTGDNGVIIFDGDINVHDCPSISCEIVTKLKYGEEVRILQQTQPLGGYPGWLHIEKKDASAEGGVIRGWIPKGNISYVKEPPKVDVNLNPPYRQMHVCGGNVVVRSGPGNGYSQKGNLDRNFNTNIILEWQDWYLVYTNSTGETGWITASTNVCQGYVNSTPVFTGNVAGETFFEGIRYVPPVDNRRITSPFGPRTILDQYDFHRGTDYVPDSGEICGSPIRAAAEGNVRIAVEGFSIGGFNRTFIKFSNFVVIDHPNSTATSYYHLDEVFVNKNDEVKAGEVIGTMGSTGFSSGCHLHFEIWADKNDRSSAIDPELVLNRQFTNAELEILGFESSKLSNIERYGNNRDEFQQMCGYTYREIKSADVADGTGMQWSGIAVYVPEIDDVILVKNGMLDIYENNEQMCGILGAPKHSDGWVDNQRFSNHYTDIDAHISPFGTKGWVQRFENGSIYFNDKQWNGYAVVGEISKIYEAAGGTNSMYGFPTSEEYSLNDGVICQRFEDNKEICNNQDARYSTIQLKESEIKNNTRIGRQVERCGTLVQYYRRTDTGETSVIMHNPENNQAYYMTGYILNKFRNLNGSGGRLCDSSYPTKTGYPRNDESQAAESDQGTSGKYQNYYHKDRGWNTIYNSKHGTYWVAEGVRDRHQKSGGTNSDIGFPIEDRSWKESRCQNEGYRQEFEGSTIYSWSGGNYSLSKVHENHWYKYYERNNGGVEGDYGWPKEERWTWAGSGLQQLSFERGFMERKKSKAWSNWNWENSYLLCQNSENGCRDIKLDIKEDFGKYKSDTYIITIPHNSCSDYLYDVNLKQTDKMRNKVNDYINQGYAPIAGINGDYKDENDEPEGFNLTRKNIEKNGKHKNSRYSLKIDKENKPSLSRGVAYDRNIVALGGGFNIINKGKYKFELTCYSESNYTQEIDCENNVHNTKSVELNGDPVGFSSGLDYTWAVDGMPETGFLARTGQTIIGISNKGDLILASTPGYTKKLGVIRSVGGIELEELADELIKNYNVVEAFRPDGGNETSIYHETIGTKNVTEFDLRNEIPTGLFIFYKDNAPYEY